MRASVLGRYIEIIPTVPRTVNWTARVKKSDKFTHKTGASIGDADSPQQTINNIFERSMH